MNMNKNLCFLLLATSLLSGIPYICYATEDFGTVEEVKDVKNQYRDDMVYRVNLGRADDIKILIKKGASVNETNDAGVPVIALAAGRTDSEAMKVVKILTEAGADINKTDARGQNALFYSAKTGNKEIVKYLLAQKIRYTAIDSSGNNARIAAYQTGHNEIVEVIDEFVRGENEASRKQYEELNKKLGDYYKAYNETVQAQKQKDTNDDTKSKLVEPDLEKANIKDLIYKASFANCAASYWQFCSTAGQLTEFGTQNLTNISSTQLEYASKIAGDLSNNYRVGADVIQNIVTTSGNKINKQLVNFGSNDARKEAGVGTLEDMNKRCRIIASEQSNATSIVEQPKQQRSIWGGWGQRTQPQPLNPQQPELEPQDTRNPYNQPSSQR